MVGTGETDSGVKGAEGLAYLFFSGGGGLYSVDIGEPLGTFQLGVNLRDT